MGLSIPLPSSTMKSNFVNTQDFVAINCKVRKKYASPEYFERVRRRRCNVQIVVACPQSQRTTKRVTKMKSRSFLHALVDYKKNRAMRAALVKVVCQPQICSERLLVWCSMRIFELPDVSLLHSSPLLQSHHPKPERMPARIYVKALPSTRHEPTWRPSVLPLKPYIDTRAWMPAVLRPQGADALPGRFLLVTRMRTKCFCVVGGPQITRSVGVGA